MRQLPRRNSRPLQKRPQSKTRWFGPLLALATLPGCGGGGTSSGPPPPPPPTISVSVSPLNESVLLGKTAQFTATVTGASNQAVNWSVNGVNGGKSTVGTISSEGLYTAPADLLAPANVTIIASSAAQPASTGHAQVTVTSDIIFGISPNSTMASEGQPDPTSSMDAQRGRVPQNQPSAQPQTLVTCVIDATENHVRMVPSRRKPVPLMNDPG